MKVILYSLLGCLLLIGCKKESGQLDPDAKISVTGVRSLTKEPPTGLIFRLMASLIPELPTVSSLLPNTHGNAR